MGIFLSSSQPRKEDTFHKWNDLPFVLRNAISCFLPVNERPTLGRCSRVERKQLTVPTSWCPAICLGDRWTAFNRAINVYPEGRCQILLVNGNHRYRQTKEQMKIIKKKLFPAVTHLWCWCNQDWGFSYCSEMPSLKTLTLTGLFVQEPERRALASCSKLENINFTCCVMCDRADTCKLCCVTVNHVQCQKNSPDETCWLCHITSGEDKEATCEGRNLTKMSLPTVKQIAFRSCPAIDPIMILNELGQSGECKQLESLEFTSDGQFQITQPTFTKESLQETLPRLRSVTMTENSEAVQNTIFWAAALKTAVMLLNLKLSGALGEINVEVNGFKIVKRVGEVVCV